MKVQAMRYATSRSGRLGWITLLLVGLFLVACRPSATDHQTLETFVASLPIDRVHQVVAPYHVCYDVGGRCYLMAHYTTPADQERIAAALDQRGFPVLRDSTIRGMSIATDINFSTDHRFTVHCPDSADPAVPSVPPAMQWIIVDKPEKVLRWYGILGMEHAVYLDDQRITENILTIAVRTR